MQTENHIDHPHRIPLPAENRSLWRLTAHARRRLSQRGLTRGATQLVLDYGAGHAARGDCCRYWLPASRAAEALADGAPLALVEKASTLAVIASNDGVVVTAYHCTLPFLRKSTPHSGAARRPSRR